jgi:hypothetical protein
MRIRSYNMQDEQFAFHRALRSLERLEHFDGVYPERESKGSVQANGTTGTIFSYYEKPFSLPDVNLFDKSPVGELLFGNIFRYLEVFLSQPHLSIETLLIDSAIFVERFQGELVNFFNILFFNLQIIAHDGQGLRLIAFHEADAFELPEQFVLSFSESFLGW